MISFVHSLVTLLVIVAFVVGKHVHRVVFRGGGGGGGGLGGFICIAFLMHNLPTHLFRGGGVCTHPGLSHVLSSGLVVVSSEAYLETRPLVAVIILFLSSVPPNFVEHKKEAHYRPYTQANWSNYQIKVSFGLL
jgi:hypothetical protein